MAWKLMRLQPLKPFFFGKESVFTNSFYAHSEYYPQQTQITGALRLYWMEQNALMKVHKHGRFCTPEKKEEALKLVGDAGSRTFSENDNLGKFTYISPMFILQLNNDCITDALFDIPSDIVQKECIKTYAKPKVLTKSVSSRTPVILENYNAKNGFVSGLGGYEFWDAYRHYNTIEENYIRPHDKVFIPQNQVGIALDENKQTLEGQFYTKRSYKLDKNFEFGLLVDVDENNLEDDKKLRDGIITLGAESSVFNLKVADIPATLQKHPIINTFQNPVKKEGRKIITLSDAMMDKSIADKAFFQIVPARVKFKMMQHRSDTKEEKLNQKTKKSEEKLLVPKGSIYYFDTPSDLPSAKGAYKKMGFNQYLVLN